MSDKESQENELSALESIYNAEEIKIIEDSGKSGGQFYAYPDISSDFKIIYRDLRKEDNEVTEVSIRYLPPLVLYFSLPPDYPSTNPPDFTLSCKWLRKIEISKLCRKLDDIWEENKGMEILFLWTQFLKEEALKFLGHEEKLDLSAMYTFNQKFIANHRSESIQKVIFDPSSNENKHGNKSLRNIFLTTDGKDKKLGHNTRGRGYSSRGRRGYRTNWKSQRNWENRYTYTPSPPSESDTGTKEDNAGIRQRKTETKENILEKSSEMPATAPQANGIAFTSRQSRTGDPRAVLDISPFTSVVRVIVDYNKIRDEEVFKRNFYTCKICFQDKVGAQSTKFDPCGHVFCRNCISSYLEVRIKEGTVHHIACPEDKCTSEATPAQVQELVSRELFQKYDSVLLNAMLDSMEDVIYCPRSFCQYPTTRDPDEKMATCPACNYVFCVYCKMVYHGVEPCRYKSDEKMRLVEEYRSADEKQKEVLEQRYGRRQLQLLVDNTMSEAWISSNSKNCPNCNAAIEKSDGCNKMVCWRCNTYFCWICSARLNPQCPYLHFSSRSSKCFNLLFHGVELDAELDAEMDEEEEDEEEEFGAFIGLVA
ncbi:E3 ubiquitin-protein ligase RNF14-like isoform X1 [Schistocerca piceifrons]|uniref:E3 ubiquitin-protein ligase RNF14-like isoform X1 n=2 Tax=Schistocerca piceifrons TaxID=274613 RepID=UPI001F5E62FF|nr:E3 ubiquitin-protein ligase RNF14-like isoform X1 [Schistocerca piceifrons]